jgi:CMP-N-acetylneuraminic acid synthetase
MKRGMIVEIAFKVCSTTARHVRHVSLARSVAGTAKQESRSDSMIYALQTARRGSESVKGKNTLMLGGIPLFLHNILHAKRSRRVDRIFVTTDDPEIVSLAEAHDYQVIARPPELAGSEVSHHDVIVHGLLEIERKTGTVAEVLVILLGNNLGAYPDDLDRAIGWLLEDPEADSCQSVSEFNMFNPFRAYREVGGRLETIMPQDMIAASQRYKDVNDKRAAGDTYFFNGSFWVVRRRALMSKDGLLPFPWLGKRIIPLVQPPVMELDAAWQIPCLAAQASDCEGVRR